MAIDAITELRAAIGSVVDQYAALAGACDSYAATVEEKRREIVDLGLEVLRVLAEEAALTIGIGLVTAGVGAAGKGALAGARIAAYAPRFAAIVSALRAAGAATATTIRTGTTALRAVRSQLVKYLKVLEKRSVARGEAGSIRLLPRSARMAAAARALRKPHPRTARGQDRRRSYLRRLHENPISRFFDVHR